MTRSTEAVHPPTMADVAREAGVSHQTVSRVLSGHPNVRASTREQVTAAIERLGYRRNPAARALVTRRTRTLGVVAVDPTLYGPASTLAGLQEAARDEGYLVSTVTLRNGGHALADALDHLAAWGVEGAVVITPQRSSVRALARLAPPFPVVTVEGSHDLDIPGVSLDQELGARLVTEHLLAAGHGTVWHVAGPEDWLESAARTEGWRAVLEERGIEPPRVLRGDWSPLSGYHAGQELAGLTLARRGSPPVTAAFVANDQMALGVLRALREAGIHTPRQVAVAGFDDIPEAGFFPPPLTTVRQDFTAIGRRSIQLLLEHIEGVATGTEHVVVEPQLIVRASTRAPVDAPA
ncbi:MULTISPECIES: LacI family DNA-binding transcriptional regulator [unclassified Streptomyces]|uniref:LacI family DNA-binding transcriptional regulator n=1 Tax=unclassified Streptomyces TaxID=2593676 RepID=UPI0013688CA4|nr:LacI family DNA-binding transcriptional regulator [Streptomyces sp. YIM 132580]MXG30011.1 LacI family DNA-binding transcriptional regulator [Streptomyces sp. YIM 132580]